MKKLLSFFLFLSLGVLTAVAGDKLTYRYAPELGKTVHYEMRMTMPIPSQQTGKTHAMTVTMKMDNTPIERKDGVTTLEGRLSNMDATISDIPKEGMEMMKGAFKAANDQFEKMRIITQIKLNGAVASQPKIEGLSPFMQQMMGNQFSQMNLTDQLKGFPDYPIGVGDTWTNEMKSNDMAVHGENKLIELTATTFTVATTGQVSITTQGEKQSFTVQATVKYDRKTGVNLPKGTHMDIKGTVGTAEKSMPMNVTIEM